MKLSSIRPSVCLSVSSSSGCLMPLRRVCCCGPIEQGVRQANAGSAKLLADVGIAEHRLVSSSPVACTASDSENDDCRMIPGGRDLCNLTGNIKQTACTRHDLPVTQLSQIPRSNRHSHLCSQSQSSSCKQSRRHLYASQQTDNLYNKNITMLKHKLFSV